MRASPLKLKSVFLTTPLFCLACIASHAAPIDVFILAGQSNAVGVALSAELSPDLDSLGVPYNSYAANSNSVLYANRERDVNNLSIIIDQPFGDLRIKPQLKPWKGELGVELSLARDLADASSNLVAFVKYSIGSTDIDRWDGPNDLYPPFYNYLSEMKAELTAAGHTVQWRGAFWVQGESDAYEHRAPLYTTKFNQLFNRLRTDLGASDMPVVMAQLKSNLVDEPWYSYSIHNQYLQSINSDMAQVASADPLVAITGSSNDLSVRDGIHYTADDYVELGHRLAESYLLTWPPDLADFNGDTVVDGADFLTWQHNFGSSGVSATHAKGDANRDGFIDTLDFGVWESQLPDSADFNGDTVVDGADFLTWQRNFGSSGVSATHAKGDANGDGFIDTLDFRVWESQLPDSADFNGDSVVDGADFLTWQRNIGSSGVSATHAKGDANGDGFIDTLDFRVWESQLVGTPSLAAASVVIPEPSSLLLALTACLIGYSRRRPV